MHPSMHPFACAFIHSSMHPEIQSIFHPFHSIIHSSYTKQFYLQLIFTVIIRIACLGQPCSSVRDLPRITGLVSTESTCTTMQPRINVIPFTGPGKRLDNVTGHIVHGPPYNPHLMIQPVSTPFVFKQFRYVMNGHYTGELFLSNEGDCQFRSARTGKLTERHGRWYFCNYIQAIKAYFDFEGKAKQAKYK